MANGSTGVQPILRYLANSAHPETDRGYNNVVHKTLPIPTPVKPSVEESELVAIISEGFLDEFWQRYRTLVARQTANTMTEIGREERIRLSDTVEESNLRRTECLIALAKRRGVSLREVVEQLGLRRVPVNE